VAQRLDRVRLLDERPEPEDPDRPQGVGDCDRHEEPVRHEARDQRRVGDDVPDRRRAEQASDHEQDLEVQDDPEDDADDEVDLALERRQDTPERTRTRGDPIREARALDLLGDVAARAGRREAAGEHLVPRALADDVRLAGQLGFVEADRARGQATVKHDLIARAELDEVAHDELLRPDLANIAAADDRGRGPGQQGDVVEGSLCAHLLHDADDDVGRDNEHRDKRIDRSADRDERDRERDQDVVDEGEDVLAQDLCVRARRRRQRGIAVARGAASDDLVVGQAAQRRLDHTLHRPRIRGRREGLTYTPGPGRHSSAVEQLFRKSPPVCAVLPCLEARYKRAHLSAIRFEGVPV
jgi:hypothetical protein